MSFMTADSDTRQQILPSYSRLPPVASRKSNNGYTHKRLITHRVASQEHEAKVP